MTTDNVLSRDVRFQPLSNLNQQFVTDLMAQRIVNLFKTVQIDEHDHQITFPAITQFT